MAASSNLNIHLSGHEESYNPPPEYLPTDEEVSGVIQYLTLLLHFETSKISMLWKFSNLLKLLTLYPSSIQDD